MPISFVIEPGVFRRSRH